MTPHKTILLDVGGTFIKCSDGREIPIDSAGGRDDIAASLRSAVCAGEEEELRSVQFRVAIPGPFDFKTGRFLMKHKFAAVYGEYFADLAGVPRENCRFIHDVNCMLLGETTCGAGKGYKKVALITLGTGLGFSMSIDGWIPANELGSPKVGIFNLPCRDGILEDYVSKRGITRGFDGLSAKEVAMKAYSGDAGAAGRFAECGALLAGAVAPLLEQYGIECLLLGGQISRSFSLMENALVEGLSGVPGLLHVGPVSDISGATFNGLESLISTKTQ